MTEKSKKRTLQFKTEVSQLLDLMIHSLYSNRDVFLRELVSNASDALDKLRFASLSNEKLLEGDSDYQIKIEIIKDNKQVIISDNGIGMSEEEVINNIGTIANSGTKKFLEEASKNKQNDSNLIGQFGVGFYSAFMVSSKVVLETRQAGAKADLGVRWSSSGDGKFNLQKFSKKDKGTRVILTLRDDAEEYLHDWKVRNIISQYSEHLPFPVLMQKVDEEKGDAAEKSVANPCFEAVNSAEAMWLKTPKDIKQEEYKEFYKHISHDFDEPLCWIHNRVEGQLEYSSLLYIPKRAPFGLFDRDQKSGLKLYVKRVFIMDDAENLLPQWLRFVKGVVDCSDLPLNISREILQDNQLVHKIRASLIKRILNKIEDLSKKDSELFDTFWKEFSKVIKEGMIDHHDNKDKVANILRFSTTKEEKQSVSFTQYIENMQKGQESIFYLCADSYAAAKSSPHLELFLEKNIEVLLLSDRIDEWVVSNFHEFQGKKLQAVNRLAADMLELEKIKSKGSKKAKDEVEEVIDSKKVIEKIKKALGDKVSEVRESKRLRTSPSCVVTDNSQMTHNMQKIMQAMGQDMQEIKPILEINPSHHLVKRLDNISDDNQFADWATLLLDQALLAEGANLDNPGEFVSRLNRLLSSS